jgi:hypothetical protein
MCVVWWASSARARFCILEIQSSNNLAASRNPRARSILVSAAVMACVIVNRGKKLRAARWLSKQLYDQ